MEVREQNALLKAEMFGELTRNVLPYWMNSMVDEKFGGFYGRRDGFDRLVENSPKAIILNTRILWTFAQAARQISTQYLPIADRAYSYLLNNFFDAEQGGVYWMLDHTGKPVETKKQVYAQAFAIYALSEYYLATKKKEALEKAIHLFELIERYSFDPVYNGYLEAFDRDWRLLEDLRLSEKDANEKKTMNTHLHVLEAYTNLYRCWPDDKLRKQLRNLIIVFRDKIINNDLHFRLFFDEQWNSKSNEISYGHDIEGSWLLYEAAEVLDDHDLLKEIKHLSVAMVDVAIRQGLDDDGGLMNEAHDADKHWWPQAEALVGLVNAWQLTSRSEYLDLTSQVWSFIKTRMIDRKHGEWYWRVDRDGNVNFSEDKAGPWKCPYHNGRAMLELLRRLG
jgi:mannobiose 2-epimerase